MSSCYSLRYLWKKREVKLSEDITALFHCILTTLYFKWGNKFYEQLDGVIMGNPVSPVIPNYYMKTFRGNSTNFSPKETNNIVFAHAFSLQWKKKPMMNSHF